jgi:hypothetical protein
VKNPLDYPLLIFVTAFLSLWLAAWIGARLSQLRSNRMADDERSDFGTIQAATLTLLGLIIGFSFSMATGRYDQRKTYEESEANAIGTEYVRADLLPQANAAHIRELLLHYTDLRIEFYRTRNLDELARLDQETTQLQNQLWTAASQPGIAQPTPVTALAIAGMNDVLNSQGYTQSAWWNRIPVAAWALMFGIALFANGLLGYGARRMKPQFFMVLPLVVAVSFLLIADIDSPRGGVIRVYPQNLVSLKASLQK